MGDDDILDDDHADIIELRQGAADHGVGLVDEDDLHRAVMTWRTAGLVHLHTGPLVKFLKRRKLFSIL